MKFYLITFVINDAELRMPLVASLITEQETEEFDLYEVHLELLILTGQPAVMLNYREVSEKQAEQYYMFVDRLHETDDPPSPVLSLVKPEEKKED